MTMRATSLTKGSLRARDTRLVGVDRDRLAQRAGKGLERSLDHVVGVRPGTNPYVQGQLGAVGDGTEELLGKLSVKARDRCRGQVGVKGAVGPPGDVDRTLSQRLV